MTANLNLIDLLRYELTGERPDFRGNSVRENDSLVASIEALERPDVCVECGGDLHGAGYGICAGCQAGMRND